MVGRKRRIALATVTLPFLFLAMSGMARAATLTVTNTNDTGVGSLRGEILAAASGDTINFSVSGTIPLGSTLPAIVNNLTIDGSGQSITVDGKNSFQILIVDSGFTLKLQNLTIARGGLATFGGGVSNNGTLTVTNSTFSGNTADSVGGGIFNGGMLTVTNSTFSGNAAFPTKGPGIGGAIENDGTLSVTSSTFSNNGATSGGAILNNGTMTVINSTFSGNSTNDNGGGIENFRALTVANSTFFGNSAQLGGGIDNVGTQTVTNSTFSDNSAVFGGGGILNEPLGSTRLKGSILAGEPGGNCGGLFTDAGYNISDDVSCHITSGTSVNGSTTLHLDPAGLADNGGPTQTIALERNSEAVDFIPVASCTDQSSPTPQPLTTDQRGLPRPDPGDPDFCDAGAFELQTMPFVLAPNSERVQIARSTTPDSDQVNMAFTFTENGFPSCDSGDDAFNGFDADLLAGSCETHDHTGLFLSLDSWVVHTVNHENYGTLFQSLSPGTVSARMVALPTPASPACGEWTVNIEVAGIDSSDIGDGPFSLVLSNPDGDTGCFDITNAIVGSQTPPPPHGVRRRVRRR